MPAVGIGRGDCEGVAAGLERVGAREASVEVDSVGVRVAGELESASDALTPESSRELVLAVFRGGLQEEAKLRIDRNRREIVSSIETWWDKYKVTLGDIQAEREKAEESLAGYLKEFSYE